MGLFGPDEYYEARNIAAGTLVADTVKAENVIAKTILLMDGDHCLRASMSIEKNGDVYFKMFSKKNEVPQVTIQMPVEGAPSLELRGKERSGNSLSLRVDDDSTGLVCYSGDPEVNFKMLNLKIRARAGELWLLMTDSVGGMMSAMPGHFLVATPKGHASLTADNSSGLRDDGIPQLHLKGNEAGGWSIDANGYAVDELRTIHDDSQEESNHEENGN
jgi:hypothetical protein